MRKKLLQLLTIISFASTPACLMTRNQIQETEQKRAMQDQVVTLQRLNADQGNRFNEIMDELRETNGRIGALENKIDQSNAERERLRKLNDEAAAENNRKFALLQEDIVKLQGQLAELQAQMAAPAPSPKRASSNDNVMELGDDAFAKKDWKKAAYYYQKFRESHPKHKSVAEATYKIGLSFVELGLKDEAKTFFEEVVTRFPSSAAAKSAKARLKKLK